MDQLEEEVLVGKGEIKNKQEMINQLRRSFASTEANKRALEKRNVVLDGVKNRL